MIVDRIENIGLYAGLPERLRKALEILQDDGLADKQDGQYQVDGNNIFYIVERYRTVEAQQGKFEAHRKYIDIQVVLDGAEMIGWAPVDQLEVAEPYNPERDYLLLETPKTFTQVKLAKGMFTIFFPSDAHMPRCHSNIVSDVVKVVVKVRV